MEAVYMKLKIRKNVPPVQPHLLSDKLYNECMKMAKKNSGPGATPWIHLADAVSRGTISPLEAYEAIRVGYLPEVLKVRDSKYNHLL
jgi:hypothetical protein